ncbi:MAG: DNA adenine methylase, partial [Candidatus Faecousia sp.]|nr:DNA adenine methylase [Candidatus Faecousia sp.]
MFPKEFGRYIEIFGGSGAVLLGKEPSKFEVYNDIEGELVNFFRVVKNRPAELLLELDLLGYFISCSMLSKRSSSKNCRRVIP